jgi:hypothetical protein
MISRGAPPGRPVSTSLRPGLFFTPLRMAVVSVIADPAQVDPAWQTQRLPHPSPYAYPYDGSVTGAPPTISDSDSDSTSSGAEEPRHALTQPQQLTRRIGARAGSLQAYSPSRTPRASSHQGSLRADSSRGDNSQQPSSHPYSLQAEAQTDFLRADSYSGSPLVGSRADSVHREAQAGLMSVASQPDFPGTDSQPRSPCGDSRPSLSRVDSQSGLQRAISHHSSFRSFSRTSRQRSDLLSDLSHGGLVAGSQRADPQTRPLHARSHISSPQSASLSGAPEGNLFPQRQPVGSLPSSVGASSPHKGLQTGSPGLGSQSDLPPRCLQLHPVPETKVRPSPYSQNPRASLLLSSGNKGEVASPSLPSPSLRSSSLPLEYDIAASPPSPDHDSIGSPSPRARGSCSQGLPAATTVVPTAAAAGVAAANAAKAATDAASSAAAAATTAATAAAVAAVAASAASSAAAVAASAASSAAAVAASFAAAAAAAGVTSGTSASAATIENHYHNHYWHDTAGNIESSSRCESSDRSKKYGSSGPDERKCRRVVDNGYQNRGWRPHDTHPLQQEMSNGSLRLRNSPRRSFEWKLQSDSAPSSLKSVGQEQDEHSEQDNSMNDLLICMAGDWASRSAVSGSVNISTSEAVVSDDAFADTPSASEAGVSNDAFADTPFIEVFWSRSGTWYAGRVCGKDDEDGKWLVDYEEGNVERLDLFNGLEIWRYIDESTVMQRRQLLQLSYSDSDIK